jgi:hypothetical protein
MKKNLTNHEAKDARRIGLTWLVRQAWIGVPNSYQFRVWMLPRLRKIGDQLANLAPNCSGFAKFALDSCNVAFVVERVSD